MTATPKLDMEQARRLVAAASPAPWHSCDDIAPKLHLYAAPLRAGTDQRDVEYLGQSYCDGAGQGRANMKFIAFARSALPAAIERVEELEREVERLREAHDSTDEVRMVARMVAAAERKQAAVEERDAVNEATVDERERCAALIDERADGIGDGRDELTECEHAAAGALYAAAAEIRAAKGTP